MSYCELDDYERRLAKKHLAELTSTKIDYIVRIYATEERVPLHDYKTTSTLATAQKWAKRASAEGMVADIYKRTTMGLFVESYPGGGGE